MSKEAWLANYERSEECSRMIDRPAKPAYDFGAEADYRYAAARDAKLEEELDCE